MVLNCYDLRTHTRQLTRGVTFAADVIRTLHADWSQRSRTGSQLATGSVIPRTANWSCSELQGIACRRTELNLTELASSVQFSSVQFVDMHWA
jgi:hypothetical protein